MRAIGENGLVLNSAVVQDNCEWLAGWDVAVKTIETVIRTYGTDEAKRLTIGWFLFGDQSSTAYRRGYGAAFRVAVGVGSS